MGSKTVLGFRVGQWWEASLAAPGVENPLLSLSSLSCHRQSIAVNGHYCKGAGKRWRGRKWVRGARSKGPEVVGRWSLESTGHPHWLSCAWGHPPCPLLLSGCSTCTPGPTIPKGSTEKPRHKVRISVSLWEISQTKSILCEQPLELSVPKNALLLCLPWYCFLWGQHREVGVLSYAYPSPKSVGFWSANKEVEQEKKKARVLLSWYLYLLSLSAMTAIFIEGAHTTSSGKCLVFASLAIHIPSAWGMPAIEDGILWNCPTKVGSMSSYSLLDNASPAVPLPHPTSESYESWALWGSKSYPVSRLLPRFISYHSLSKKKALPQS